MGTGARIRYTEEQSAAIKEQIASENVLIYIKDYCPYCKAAKKMLSMNGVSPAVVEINMPEAQDSLYDEATIKEILLAMTGQKTVPNIFIGGVHEGGQAQLFALTQSGILREMLDELGVASTFPSATS